MISHFAVQQLTTDVTKTPRMSKTYFVLSKVYFVCIITTWTKQKYTLRREMTLGPKIKVTSHAVKSGAYNGKVVVLLHIGFVEGRVSLLVAKTFCAIERQLAYTKVGLCRMLCLRTLLHSGCSAITLLKVLCNAEMSRRTKTIRIRINTDKCT